MRREEKMLRALLADERLDEEQIEAFSGMLNRLERNANASLSPRQLAWVADVFARLDLNAGEPTGPAFSAGTIQKGRNVALLVDALPRPLRPPGR